MKHLRKVLPLIILVSLCLTACSDDDAKLPKPDARISVVVNHGYYSALSTAPQTIVVDANAEGYYRLRINIDNGESSYDTRASLAIDSLNGTPATNGLFTEETVEVSRYLKDDLNVKLTPGAYTLTLDGALTQVKIIVNPNGTIPSPATTADPA
jgi:hypothetical protein